MNLRLTIASSVLVVAVAGATAHAAPRSVLVIAATTGDPVVDASVKAIAGADATIKAGAVSLADSALILGCDPEADDCRDAVTDQLAVDELVVVTNRGDGAIMVASYRRGGAPGTRKTYPVGGADDAAGLKQLGDGTAAAVAARSVDPVGERTMTGPAATTRGGIPRGALYIGVGGAVLVLSGAVAWGLAGAKQGEIDDAPTATAADLAHLADLESSGRAYAAAGNGLVIGGAIALAAAGTWIYLNRRRERSVQVAPAIGPGTAAVTLGGQW